MISPRARRALACKCGARSAAAFNVASSQPRVSVCRRRALRVRRPVAGRAQVAFACSDHRTAARRFAWSASQATHPDHLFRSPKRGLSAFGEVPRSTRSGGGGGPRRPVVPSSRSTAYARTGSSIRTRGSSASWAVVTSRLLASRASTAPRLMPVTPFHRLERRTRPRRRPTRRRSPARRCRAGHGSNPAWRAASVGVAAHGAVPTRTVRASSKRLTRSRGASSGTCPAASSMANGIPSTRLQISAMEPALPSLSAKPGSRARQRSAKRRIAGER